LGEGERGKVPGAVVTLAKDGSYASHQRVDLNNDAAYERRPDGQLVLKQDFAILPEGMSKEGLSASDLEITPDGRFIFAGLRGHRQDFDRIARCRVKADGHAELLGLTPADKIPWGLALSPDAKHLLVSAYNGATLTAYRITSTGDLEKAASQAWDAEISDLLTR
jgi:6-phosphogluconolactonase (cycloisomerase 2 family)